MSKSLGNYIGINEAPEEIYGKTMSIPDTLIEKYVRLVSGLPAEEIRVVLALKPRDSKAALARQLVTRLHGDAAAARAEAHFVSHFVKRETAPDEEHTIAGPSDTISLLLATGIAKSGNEARRLVEQGGVRVNGIKVDLNSPAPKVGDVISARRRFIRLK
jgi:tyrosyl-tRNA synthetase